MKKTLVVLEKDAGSRADKFVGQELQLSRAKLKALFDEGLVRVDGHRVAKGTTLSSGAQVELEISDEPSCLAGAPDVPLQVIYEDPHVIVLDKPAGIPVHPLSFEEKGTLAQALIARFPECNAASPQAPLECGIAHRLDTETSGVVVAGRSEKAYRALRSMFSERQVEKHYVALVGGMLPPEGEVTFPIAHHPGDKSKMVVCPDDEAASSLKARPATTRWKVLRWLGDMALVDVEIPTGVRHQIRVHMSSLGAPIVGDVLYGGELTLGLTRHFLHASAITFIHPISHRSISVDAPLPDDLKTALKTLETSGFRR